MALYKDDSQEDAQECPVCYENLSGSERTLSCRHVFCHDCLVKTLVSINSDGVIKDTIACPICRHLTFIKRQKDALASLSATKYPDGQTLEVPLPPTPPQLRSAQRASGGGLLSGVNRLAHCCGSIFGRVRQKRLIGHNHSACQIFVISAEGRPMTEEDAVEVVMTMVHPHRRERRRVCSTARCLLCLLSAFTVLALVAATLPWILLS
ncbi:RING finger protein 222 [Anableps anableps]